MSTVQLAYAFARSGQFKDLASVKTRLKADGCRAVDALLASPSLRRHLEAICAATSAAATSQAPVTAAAVTTPEDATCPPTA